jgi:hypothetical protein
MANMATAVNSKRFIDFSGFVGLGRRHSAGSWLLLAMPHSPSNITYLLAPLGLPWGRGSMPVRYSSRLSMLAVLFALSASAYGADVVPGTYRVGSVSVGNHCADIGSENVNKEHDNIHRFPCNQTVFQKWVIANDQDRPGRYLISWEGSSGKFWSAEHFNPRADHLTFDPRHNNSFQSWTITDAGNGKYRISNDGNSKCVDPQKNGNEKENIKLEACKPGDGQLWYLEKLS